MIFGGIWIDEVKTHEGSLKFENVMLGEPANDYATAPVYNGFASFFYGGGGMTNRTNVIYIGCDDPNMIDDKVVRILDIVDIWIDR